MNNKYYKTRDLAESAALLVKNQRLLDIEKIGKICWFYFENREECTRLSNEYFFGDLLVNAREFHQAMTRLKNRIYNTCLDF